MVDALVSIILEQLDSANQEVRQVVGVKEEVPKLTKNLRAIQDVLEAAEKRQVNEPTVKGWLDKLKDVIYDMDNVLDEWNTANLKKKIEEVENALKPKRKVCSFIPSCFCCGQVAQNHDIPIKIKEINKRLDVLANEKSKFNFKFTSVTSYKELEQQMIDSIDVPEVHGRDQDKNTIVSLLSNISQGSTLRIISIVGMGGIGKTTLAKLVYNDDTVKAHFQKRIWVCVSDPFDEIRIAKIILKALKDNGPNLNESKSLFQNIHQSIKGNKFLLVLDDVWTEDHKKLEQLKILLKLGSPGSSILVTTRKETVAKIIETTNEFQLRGLSNEECWSLFSQVAFFRKTSEEREILEDIGRSISNKCNGLPFAAKVLGSLLCFKKTREEWQSVLDSEVWELEEAERGPLLLSYYDLPSTMRQCFSYCAIFPKDYELEKDRLIKLWMAQGYLRATDSRHMEMVGAECFNNLAIRSFFQDFEKDKLGTITCKMHNIVHDFAQFLTKKECSVMEVIGLDRLRLNFHHVKVCHSMFILDGDVSIFAPIKYIENLRSLIVEYKNLRLTGASTFEVLDKFTCLRTLDFRASNHYRASLEKFPMEIGKLIHLRYLNLAHNDKLKELPETMCNLYNLQSLNVTYCTSLKTLPREFGKLINLRHLEMVSSSVSFMPKGIERLTSLRTLDTFVVSSDVNDSDASNIGDLENLNHIRGYLEILGLGKVRYVDEVKKAKLMNKEQLKALVLDFRLGGNKTHDEQVINAIQTPLNLEELSINWYKGVVFPNWNSLTNLKKVDVCNWNCEFLPPLGKLSSLESLHIRGMMSVKRVGVEFLGIESAKSSLSSMSAFPKLEELSFWEMEVWEEWDITTDSTIVIMPCLCSLKISKCPQLKALPNRLLNSILLQELEISYCRILEERYDMERKGAGWFNNFNIPNIVINNGHFLALVLNFGSFPGRMRNNKRVIEAIQPPPNLEELSMIQYEGTMLPNWISLTNLKKVYFCDWNCELLPPLGKLSSLESLNIRGMLKVKRVGIGFLGIESEINKNHNNESPSKKYEAKTSSSSVIAFPTLEKLFLWEMEEWEEWDYGMTRSMTEKEDITIGSTITIMPRLRSLKLSKCPKLKALPDHLLHSTSLKELDIEGCPIVALNNEQVIEGIQPLPNLEELSMIRYEGTEFPNWISFTYLKKVHICDWNCELLPPLGKLLFLESLGIRGMLRVKRVGIEFLGIENEANTNDNNEDPSKKDEAKTSSSSVTSFPRLEKLSFSEMEEWEEWDYFFGWEEWDYFFWVLARDLYPSNPSQQMRLRFRIPDLARERLGPASLTPMIWDFATGPTPSWWKEWDYEIKEDITTRSTITIMPRPCWWEEWDYEIKKDITTRSTITIMPRLSSLKISNCPKLKVLPEHLLHTILLKEVDIEGCPILDQRYYKEMKGGDWPKGRLVQKPEVIE